MREVRDVYLGLRPIIDTVVEFSLLLELRRKQSFLLSSLHALAQVGLDNALRLILVLLVLLVASELFVLDDRLGEAIFFFIHGRDDLSRTNDRLLCGLSHAFGSL